MSFSFDRFIHSELFTFYIGKERKPILVHADAIAATSDKFDNLVNIGMKESQTRCAQLENVMMEDFVRFCEYAYRGDYAVPAPDEEEDCESVFWFSSQTPKKKKKTKERKFAPAVADAEPTAPDEKLQDQVPEQPEDSRIEPSICPEPQSIDPPSPTRVKHPPRTSLRTQFNDRKYLDNLPRLTPSPKPIIQKSFTPKQNTSPSQNFSPIFLAHARLYTFAYYHLIEPLKALTLDKLHRTLMDFKLYKRRIGDVISLARYAYGEVDLPNRGCGGSGGVNEETEAEEKVNELRELVVEYVVCEIDTIGQSREFLEFLEEGGEFVGDFWRVVRGFVV